MQIGDFIIQKVLQPRLRKCGCVVVYDPAKRYADLCLQIASNRMRVVDASISGIESREAALEALTQLGTPQFELDGLLIYVPADKPVTDEQMQVDPFALYIAAGGVFPDDDGDEYLNLCLRAKPDFPTEIRRVFASTPSPSLAVIDAIGGGSGWPQLRAALKVQSAIELLSALMAPAAEQMHALRDQDGWSDEFREFVRATIGLDVKSRAKTWQPLADELWRYVLFSEFAFDLTDDLPGSLAGVPRAPVQARTIIDDLCARLRSDARTRSTYIDRAEEVEAALHLPDVFTASMDLGETDTFPFEERAFLRRAAQALISDDADLVRQMLLRSASSVWQGKGESQEQWSLVQAALDLCDGCQGLGGQLSASAGDIPQMLDYYVSNLRAADRLQREFEQTLSGYVDPDGLLTGVVDCARESYRKLSERVQGLFVRLLDSAGWPPPGRLSNADVFDKFVGETLKARGRKIAFFMVDALRYELGVALESILSEEVGVVLHMACAQLPTMTLVGMASLLPGAASDLYLRKDGDTLTPYLSGAPVGNVAQRMDVLRKRYGDRFAEMTLTDFLRTKGKLADTVDLLVLRTVEIDTQLEASPETTLRLIPGTLKQVRVAISKLKAAGFAEAVIAADHGFYLNGHSEAGDVCVKPQGAWPVNAHDRMLLGDGSADVHNLVFTASKLGIRGDFAQAAVPRSMAPYRAGHLYFHGGISLAEAVVPVLVVQLDGSDRASQGAVQVEINYKNGAKRITTRVPVIDVALISDMFSQEATVEILIEAQDSKGDVVGEPRPGSDVNPATRALNLIHGQRKQVALRMDPNFEGKFTVKALNPTTLAAYCSLVLETDYTV